MKRVIIESPYAATPGRTVHQNVEYARAAMRHSLYMREAPFASHLLYTQSLDDTVPPERAMGIEAGLVWGLVADLVAVYCDHGLSKGMRLGIAAALERDTRVVYRFRTGYPLVGDEFAESLVLPDKYNHQVL